MEKWQREAYLATAARLLSLDPFTALDYDETPRGVAEIIASDPILIINELIDIIEDLREE